VKLRVATLSKLRKSKNTPAGSTLQDDIAATAKELRRKGEDVPPVNRDRAYDCIDAMRPIAQAHGVSVAQVALAWLLHQPQVTSVIIGAKRPEQLTENLAATQVALSDSELAALDEVSRLPAEYPGWMLRASAVVDGDAFGKFEGIEEGD
jgi:aryl-alcohol dehydrogenase-like predicted oxidoreductase